MRRTALVVVGLVIIASLVWKLGGIGSNSSISSEPALSPSAMEMPSTGPAMAAEYRGDGPADAQSARPVADEVHDAMRAQIPIPREFDRIPPSEIYWHDDKWRQLHRRMEGEPIDPEWSRNAEAAIGRAIGESPEINQHGVPTITCRSKTCEVQMVAFGTPDVDEGKWSTHFGDVYKKLRSDFELEDFSVAVEPEGAAMVLVVSRREAK